MPDLEKRLRDRLAELDVAGLRRSLRTPAGVDLSSNDYLGLAEHPTLVRHMAETLAREGCGSTASRLLRGHREGFTSLERKFAAFKGTESALYFSSGYLANIGVLATIPEEGDVVFSDELNHASLIDGMRLSRARRVVFPHRDVAALSALLHEERGARHKFLVTESLFSMDGDEAPLGQYADVCRAANTALIVDEAHAVGVYGKRGSGLIEEAGIGEAVFLSVNTAGKALGVGGALAAGPAWAIDYLIQRARSFIFSTAPPPAMAAALEAALELVETEPGRRTQLLRNAGLLRDLLVREGLRVPRGRSQIIPVVLGDNDRAVAASDALGEQGFDVRAIRPPTVPAGTARLRISVNSKADEATLRRFAVTLAQTMTRITPCSVVSS